LSIDVVSDTGFIDTAPITIVLDDGTTFQTYINGNPVADTITLEAALPYAAAIGKAVTSYTPATDYPRAELLSSDDYGATFTSLGKRQLGQSGGVKPKMRWGSCGSSDKDMQLRIKIPHAVEKRIYGASVDIKQGR
jgi:hypothetical protein